MNSRERAPLCRLKANGKVEPRQPSLKAVCVSECWHARRLARVPQSSTLARTTPGRPPNDWFWRLVRAEAELRDTRANLRTHVTQAAVMARGFAPCPLLAGQMNRTM